MESNQPENRVVTLQLVDAKAKQKQEIDESFETLIADLRKQHEAGGLKNFVLVYSGENESDAVETIFQSDADPVYLMGLLQFAMHSLTHSGQFISE